jgi:hypothetical protein
VILGHAGSTAAQLDASLRTLQLLFLETVRLAEGNYAPRFAPPKKAPDQL